MADQIKFIVYLCLIGGVTSIHKVPYLGIISLALFLVSGASFWGLFKKTIRAIFLFNSVVSLAFFAQSLWRDQDPWPYLVLLNFRVFILTFSTFLMIERVNLFRAAERFPSLRYLLTLASMQIQVFTRTKQEFDEALVSRSLQRPTLRTMLLNRASLVAHLMRKGHEAATEVSQAMLSRGFFND